MNLPVFDLHCDTAYAILNNGAEERHSLRKNGLHIDLERASAFKGFIQCFACFTSPLDPLCQVLGTEQVFQLEYNTLLCEFDKNADIIALACNKNEISRNYAEGKMSAILTIEGTAGFGYDAGRLEELYSKGFRMTTLGWNEENPLTGSHCTGGGLTSRGREYVKKAQALGMVVDVSHISDQGFWDIMDVTQSCVVASHSNSRTACPVSRNLTDEMFLAICSTGGVAGINLYSYFLGENPTIDAVCDHIFHFLTLDPTGKHIALGGDLDGCDRLPAGFDGVEGYFQLADRLMQRGISQEMILDLFWNNAIGVIEQCCT